MRDVFDLPDLGAMDDGIANGTFERQRRRGAAAGALHRAARRLLAAPAAPLHRHRARALPELRAVHQLPVLHRRVRAPRPRGDGRHAEQRLRSPSSSRATWSTRRAGAAGASRATTSARAPPRLPQMPAYHLVRADRSGITMVNIGVGPANAKTITDHIAVLRPHAWMMLGHCAGLRNSAAARRLRARPRLRARGPRARRGPAAVGADPGAGRDPARAREGGGRRDAAARATN